MGGVLLLLIWQLAQLARLQNEAHGWRLVLAACFVIDAVVFYFFRITDFPAPAPALLMLEELSDPKLPPCSLAICSYKLIKLGPCQHLGRDIR